MQARKEIQEGVRPELAAKVEDMGKYDVIFIGSPNWWSTIAPPVASFLASYDLSGKTVIPFVTHGAAAWRCADEVRKLCPKSTVLKGGALPGKESGRRGPRLSSGSMRRFPSINNDFMKRTIAGMAFSLPG